MTAVNASSVCQQCMLAVYTSRKTDGQRNGQTETDGQRDGQMTDGRRRTERWTDRDMNEHRRTDITGPKPSLKFSTDCVKHYTALQAEGREMGQWAERRGRETEGGVELIDRRLSSVTITDALLNKSSRHVAAVI